MARSLVQETVIVTGGGRGFGEQMSLALAQEGAKVVIAEKDQKEGKRVEESIGRGRGEALFVETDVSDEGQVERMVRAALDRFGRVDVLLNNAGVPGPIGPLQEIRTKDWEEVFAINLKGYFLCARAVLRHMIPRRSGHVINISSTTASVGFREFRSLPYTVTKYAVEGFSYCLSVQMEPYGIRVNALQPGLTITHFQKDTPPDYLKGKHTERVDHVVGPLLYLLKEFEGTGASINAPKWNAERAGRGKG